MNFKTNKSKTTRNSYSKHYRLLLIVFTGIMLLFTGCSAGSKKKSIAGIWINNSLRKEVVFSITDTGTYSISVNNEKFEFPGTYTYQNGTINLVDTYCGTVLPGKYKLKVKKDKLLFTLVSDSICTRNKILPGTWERRPKTELLPAADTSANSSLADTGRPEAALPVDMRPTPADSSSK